MKKVIQALTLGAAFAAACAFTPVQAADQSAPLIERSKLFGNPSRSGAQLSPDGKWLSWLAPRDGVMNVWLAPVAKLADARPLTSSKDRPIRQQFWAPDSSMVMYIQDKGGDENFLLYGIDVTTGTERNLTPFDKTRVQLVGASPVVKDRILVGLNNRDARWHDVHMIFSGPISPFAHWSRQAGKRFKRLDAWPSACAAKKDAPAKGLGSAVDRDYGRALSSRWLLSRQRAG